MVREFKKFIEELEKRGIEYTDRSDKNNLYKIDRIRFKYEGYEWSVINGYGTYGGFISFDANNQGLLEIWKIYSGEEPIGFLRCHEAVEIIFGD